MRNYIIYNYTSLKQRDTKIYSVGGHSFGSGISVDFLKIVGPSTLLFIILGCIISIPFHINFFNVIGEHFVPGFTLTFIVLGVGIGCGLYYIQFGGYRLYEYFFAYLKPKKVYMNDWKHSEFKLYNVSIDGFIKHLL